MSEVLFDAATPRFGLPLLAVGQAQKEVTVNEAPTAVDALLNPVAVAVSNDPPASPGNGKIWVVGPQPTAAWQGRASNLAIWQNGQWVFRTPHDRMRIEIAGSGQRCFFAAVQGDGEWRVGTEPALPPLTGGDSEVRAALKGLCDTLATLGILSRN